MSIAPVLSDLSSTFLALHTKKEDLFWESKMGLASDAAASARALGSAENDLNAFLQDPSRLASLKTMTSAASASERHVLDGWVRFFECYTIADESARALSRDIVEAESELAIARGAMNLGYVDPKTGAFVKASTNKLALLIANDENEAVRKAAHEGLRSVETFVIDHGFFEIVKMRNRLGRMLGYEDYYDWKTQIAERMSKREVFARLEDLVTRTNARSREELAKFAAKHGPSSLDPWNFSFLRSGDTAKKLDPYFPFAEALGRWGRSFAAMGVKYRGAKLTLDLVDRAGKYENGFMHGPGPAFVADGVRHAARINFTANAVPGAVGSGLTAATTLFHEGGHAAHFANIVADAPCFSMEFPPTSVAHAETQSMFMDSLLGDADWRTRYAKNAAGEAVPFELIEEATRNGQPFRGFDVRRIVTVPFGERMLYELAESELTKDRVLSELRRIEADIQGLTSSPRPVLAVPHLLAGESSAYYHAYVLAEMGVQQTRAFFLKRDGYLTDNARIGPDMAKAYWEPGNARTFDEMLTALTGKSLSADALVDACNESVDEALAKARASIDSLGERASFAGPVELDADIDVIHGRETIATTRGSSFEDAAAKFATWITTHETAVSRT